MTRILYVEDNEDNIYMLRHRLERKGIEVIVANDGAEGIESARRERPDLILMDLSLPVIDGDHFDLPQAGNGNGLRLPTETAPHNKSSAVHVDQHIF